MKEAKKCTCNLGMMIVAVALFALAVFVLVAGFSRQFGVPISGYDAQWVVINLAIYFVGFLLMVFGKMAKWKAHGNCPAHKMN